ncbi:hypothetical protein C8R45DRAFT_1102839 [Mycena sanguinolenta]|nr:hypothetical protein C8R45DRAFT_1102839 [Mycena sanguinolenta]
MVHQIHFQVDNSNTPYDLIPAEKSAFADWGDISKYPVTVPAHTSVPENGGVVKASAAPWTGAAMIVVYSIKTTTPIYLCLLGSNPDWSVRANSAYVYITTDIDEAKAGQALYNEVYKAEKTSADVVVEGGIFKVVGEIGQTDDCTATFRCTYTAKAKA